MYVFFRPAYNQLPLQDLHCQLPSWLPCLPPLKPSSLASPDENLHFTRTLTFFSTSFAFMGLSFFGPLKGPWARKDVFFLCSISQPYFSFSLLLLCCSLVPLTFSLHLAFLLWRKPSFLLCIHVKQRPVCHKTGLRTAMIQHCPFRSFQKFQWQLSKGPQSFQRDLDFNRSIIGPNNLVQMQNDNIFFYIAQSRPKKYVNFTWWREDKDRSVAASTAVCIFNFWHQYHCCYCPHMLQAQPPLFWNITVVFFDFKNTNNGLL